MLRTPTLQTQALTHQQGGSEAGVTHHLTPDLFLTCHVKTFDSFSLSTAFKMKVDKGRSIRGGTGKLRA